MRYNKSFYQLPLILTAEFHIDLIKDVYLTAMLSLSGLHMHGSRNFCQGGGGGGGSRPDSENSSDNIFF